MTDTPAWIAAGVGLAALLVGYLTYRSQRGITRLEHVVVANRSILPGRVARHLEVRHDGRVLGNPSLTIVRVVNTGDRPITAADFETGLAIEFEGVDGVASAVWTASRPNDLRPEIHIDAHRVRVSPALINPEDMLELQVIAEGKARDVKLSGRVTDLTVVRRAGLPYPPGTGREGEMLGFDKFMWYFAVPATIIAIGVGIALDDSLSGLAQVLTLVATAMLAGVLYPLHVRYLVRRRRLWRS